MATLTKPKAAQAPHTREALNRIATLLEAAKDMDIAGDGAISWNLIAEAHAKTCRLIYLVETAPEDITAQDVFVVMSLVDGARSVSDAPVEFIPLLSAAHDIAHALADLTGESEPYAARDMAKLKALLSSGAAASVRVVRDEKPAAPVNVARGAGLDPFAYEPIDDSAGDREDATGANTQNTFFSLNAEYLIKPGASMQALANDVRCLFGVGLETLEQQVHQGGGDDEAVFAPVYLLRQAMAVFQDLQSMIDRERRHA